LVSFDKIKAGLVFNKLSPRAIKEDILKGLMRRICKEKEGERRGEGRLEVK